MWASGTGAVVTAAPGAGGCAVVKLLHRPRVVVLGMITRMPVAGVIWQTLHYLLGFERLGCETFYVEAHGHVLQMLMRAPEDDAPAVAAAFLSSTLAPYGFGDRWAYHDSGASGAVFGMSETELAPAVRGPRR